VKAKLASGYRCVECSRVYSDMKDAAFCCASDRHPVVSCWRCYECGGLYLYRQEADTCCGGHDA